MRYCNVSFKMLSAWFWHQALYSGQKQVRREGGRGGKAAKEVAGISRVLVPEKVSTPCLEVEGSTLAAFLAGDVEGKGCKAFGEGG